jgi:hypothetical protein
MAEPVTSRPVQVRAEDWPAQAADAIVDAVGLVRDKATGPVLKAARAVVYGVILGVAGLALLILVPTLAVRILDIIIPGPVWSAHLVLGGVTTLVGLYLLRVARRTAPSGAD